MEKRSTNTMKTPRTIRTNFSHSVPFIFQKKGGVLFAVLQALQKKGNSSCCRCSFGPLGKKTGHTAWGHEKEMKVVLGAKMNNSSSGLSFYLATQNQRALIENKCPAPLPIKSTANSQSDASVLGSPERQTPKKPSFCRIVQFCAEFR